MRLTDLGIGATETHTANNRAISSEMIMGFFFLLRVSEMVKLRMRDIKLDRMDGCMYLDLFLTGSKTDQYNQGDHKRLVEI